jgi:Predicted signal transduction protein with a C-terminal ATPase domain
MKINWLFGATLRRQLLVLLILLLICAVSAIGIASINIAQHVIRDHTARFGGKMLTQAAYRLGSVIDNAETTVDSLILDRRLAPLLHDLASENRAVRETARSGLHDLLIQYRGSLPGAELILIDSKGNPVTTYNLPPASKDLAAIPPAHEGALTHQVKFWRLRYLPNFGMNDAKVSGRLLELTARIISLPGQPQSGWIILHMDYRIVESIMTNMSLQENTLNRFQSDAIVFGPQKQIIFPWVAPADPIFNKAYPKMSGPFRNTETMEDKIDGHNYLIITTPVPWTPWKVFISAPTRRLYAGLEQIYNSIFMIGLICIFVAIICATLISFLVTKPVHKLHKAMLSVEEGDFLVRVPESGPQEIQTLGRAFNRMLHEVGMLTKRLVAEESERKTAVIKALQAQIAPHFLFNTLAAMAGMTTKRPPEEVAEALRSLKRLLYLSIGKFGDFVSLADEFEHIHHYLYLMNIRYPGKFSLRMELPEDLRRCRIIRLVLQPVVENCIQHGLKAQGGLIRVQARQTGNDVKIRIADNGQGMSREQISAVWKQDHSRSGVGVRNVDERLKLTFGPGYGLTLMSARGKGTLVTLRIPLRHISEPENE